MKNTKTPLIPSWVHNLSDYRRMFALSDQDLTRSILEYPAGISSFNAEMKMLKASQVISGDRHYNLEPQSMVKHVEQLVQQLAEQLHHYQDRLIDAKPNAVQEIVSRWTEDAQLFLNDYVSGHRDTRYQYMNLPKLPFADFEIELALCPDILFRSGNASPDKDIMELCRVAEEVRIFPLLDEYGEISKAIGPSILNLQNKNYGVEICEVPYQLLKGSNAMLRVWAKTCVVGR